jgi:DHA1 family bicyclomycin/chloramphenicol resistance-like MFS transporter
MTMLSMIMAATALGIDMMLPAFADIRTEFGLAPDSTAVAGIVTAYFIGLASAQVVWGPFADRFGRKPTLYAGVALYMVGALGAALAPSLGFMYVMRFLWGFGSAGPRVMALAVVRDTYSGDAMARAMSFIMAIFILVPVVAPSLGAAILLFASWRWVFAACVIYAGLVVIWARRLPETLREENRMPLEFSKVARATRFVVGNRQTLGYTLALTALFGVFSSYLASSELIIGEVFDRGPTFPLVFGGLSAVMGVAMVLNGTVVGRFGVKRMVHAVMFGYLAWAAVLTVIAAMADGVPPFWPYMAGLAVMLALYALLFPNMNTIAMDPMGSVAGTAAAVIGLVSIAGGAILGSFLDRSIEDSVTPLAVGFLGYGVITLLTVLWAERGKLFPKSSPASEARGGKDPV